jgi:uncharacterized protein (TIGR03086 family)
MPAELRELDALATKVDLIELNAQAVRAGVGLLDQAIAEDLTRPTPCVGWTLHGLLAHMATQHYGFAAASRGEGDPALWKLRALGDDPVVAYRVSADHVLTAFAAEGVLDRGFPLPEFSLDIRFSAAQAISFHFIDSVVHSWDIAKTLDLAVEFEPELLEVALLVAKAAPGGPARLAPGAAFAPEVPWTGGGRLDEIVAILGRDPEWRA